MFIEYGELSTELYELTKPVGYSIEGDIEYYLQKLSHISGKILEAGVGTGRMLIPFKQKGFDIEGVDVSSPMLEQCKQNLDKYKLDAPLYLQRLESLDLPHKYQAIIMPTGSFGLLSSRQNMWSTLKNFKDHLEQDGILMLDLELPHNFSVGREQTSIHPINQQTGLLFRSTEIEINWNKQYTKELHRYEKWHDGQLIQTELSNFILHWYGIEEFKMILEKVGFHSISYTQGYGTSSHSILTFFAKK